MLENSPADGAGWLPCQNNKQVNYRFFRLADSGENRDRVINSQALDEVIPLKAVGFGVTAKIKIGNYR
ncbi:MAG: hypothetical protein M0Q95_17495 [Porticoccaceae bacterium]|nr:hypothetical protein [Porticoccaceae bacterium]